MPETLSLFTWDGSQQDFRLCKLGLFSSINDVTHHSKFAASTKLQNTGATRHPVRVTPFAYMNFPSKRTQPRAQQRLPDTQSHLSVSTSYLKLAELVTHSVKGPAAHSLSFGTPSLCSAVGARRQPERARKPARLGPNKPDWLALPYPQGALPAGHELRCPHCFATIGCPCAQRPRHHTEDSALSSVAGAEQAGATETTQRRQRVAYSPAEGGDSQESQGTRDHGEG